MEAAATAAQKQKKTGSGDVSRLALWFALLGGAFAWLFHLLLVYAISEWGCVKWPDSFDFLGITVTSWLCILASVATAAPAFYATWVGMRVEKRLRQGVRDEAEDDADSPDDVEKIRESDILNARIATIMSGLFAFVIVIESIPTFYFLQNCGR